MNVHIIGRQIHSLIRPAYCAMGNSDLRKELWISQLCENAVKVGFLEAHLALHPIVEFDKQGEWRNGFHGYDICKRHIYSTGAIGLGICCF